MLIRRSLAHSRQLRPAVAVTSQLVRAVRRYQSHSDPNDHGTPSTQLSYSKADLVGWWHQAARDINLMDLKWEGRDKLDAPYTMITATGAVQKVEDQLNKEELIDKYGIQPRDLRSLDANHLDVRPALIVCKRSIVLCTPIVRAIIAHDHILIMGSDPARPLFNDDENHEMTDALKVVLDHLEIIDEVFGTKGAKGKQGPTAFEFRALEALLLLTVRGFREVTDSLKDRIYTIIPQLRFGVSPSELRALLESKRTVEDCISNGRAMQASIADALHQDDDLAAMFLTDSKRGKPHATEDHQQAELLLEYYERKLDQVNESAERLLSLLRDLDGNIQLVLASTRVRVQNLEAQVAIMTLGLAVGTAGAGFFGMNLTSGLENHPSAFYWASGIGCTAMVAVGAFGWVRLLRARRTQLFLGSVIREQQSRKARHLSHRFDGDSTGQILVGSQQAVVSGDQAKQEEERKKEEVREQVAKAEDQHEEKQDKERKPSEKKDGSQI